jgi:hypothetical protein
MRYKQRLCAIVLLLLPLLLASCATVPSSSARVSESPVFQKTYLYEVLGHLYRWYLDEVDVRAATQGGNSTVWVRELSPELDPGDCSQFGEIVLPVLGLSVTVKKANYTIDELGVEVVSDRFKIVRVGRVALASNLSASYTPVELDGMELRDYLFQRRGEVAFPDDALVARLQAAARQELDAYIKDSGKVIADGNRTVHCAPLSPVANELWVFWEAGRVLIHFASDLDLANPYVWEHEALAAKIYDIDEQVVVSLQEAPGSNAYLTRDQVGRALYNCVILGRSYELSPPKDSLAADK